MKYDEEVILYFRTEAINTSSAPRYAFFKTPKPGRGWWFNLAYEFDPSTGFSKYSKDSIFCISKLDGSPLPNEEMSVILHPGEKAVFEFFMPHKPIPGERAHALFNQSFNKRYSSCKSFWLNKQQKAAQIQLPENSTIMETGYT